MERISHRYTNLGYSDYIYDGTTDWLVSETWHSAISNAGFDLLRYSYVNGRPFRRETAAAASDLSSVFGYNSNYLQVNYHGDVNTFINALDSAASTQGENYDPWGRTGSSTPDYYRWNGAWGYMWFGNLGLYYVHGRWYNPDTGMWLSPDAKGSYKYNEQQNAVNYAWANPAAIGDSETDPVNPVYWITAWLKHNRSQVVQAATRHTLLPEFLGAVLYLESSSPLTNAIQWNAEIRRRIDPLHQYPPDWGESLKYLYNEVSPCSLSDDATAFPIDILKYQGRSCGRSMGIGAIKPNIAVKVEEANLLYDPFTSAKAHFPSARDSIFAKTDLLTRLDNPYWSTEYLAAQLDLARQDPKWPEGASKNDPGDERAMRAMTMFHYNVDNLNNIRNPDCEANQCEAAKRWLMVKGYMPQIAALW